MANVVKGVFVLGTAAFVVHTFFGTQALLNVVVIGAVVGAILWLASGWRKGMVDTVAEGVRKGQGEE